MDNEGWWGDAGERQELEGKSWEPLIYPSPLCLPCLFVDAFVAKPHVDIIISTLNLVVVGVI